MKLSAKIDMPYKGEEMRIVKVVLFLCVVITLSFTKDRGKIVLQQGLEGYAGCIDSYVSKEFPDQKNADSDQLIMEHWWWG